MFLATALIIITIGLVHSILGEKTVIGPLMTRDTAPPYIKRLMRVGWHITTLFWFAIAAQFLAMHFYPAQSRKSFILIMAVTFGISALIALFASKGKHISWIGFGTLSILLTHSLLAT